MYHNHALVAGAVLAASAHAIMIAPNMLDPQSLEDKAASDFGLNIAKLMNPESSSRLVKVECPGCAYPVEKDVYTLDQENDLIFNFQTTDGGKKLLMNGHPFYPIDVVSGPVEMFAPQAPSDVSFDALRDSFDDVTSVPRRLRFDFGAREIEAADGADAQLADLDLHIHAIDEQEVEVDSLGIRLLRDEKGIINIVDIFKKPQNSDVAHEAEAEPGSEETFTIMPIGPGRVSPHHGHRRPACSGPAAFFCRWAEMVEEKMNTAIHGSFGRPRPHHAPKRPCPGRMGMMGHKIGGVPVKGGIPKFMPWKYTPEKIKNGHVGRPHHHGHHGHPGHPQVSFMHHFKIALKRVFFGFVVPVLIGVAAGMTASVLGMLVGSLIAYLWITVVRGGRRGSEYESVAQAEADEDEDIEDDKKALLSQSKDEEEPLPVYSERAQ